MYVHTSTIQRVFSNWRSQFQQAVRSIGRLRVAANDRAAVQHDISECLRKIASRQAAGESPALYAHLYVQMGYNHDCLGEDGTPCLNACR